MTTAEKCSPRRRALATCLALIAGLAAHACDDAARPHDTAAEDLDTGDEIDGIDAVPHDTASDVASDAHDTGELDDTELPTEPECVPWGTERHFEVPAPVQISGTVTWNGGSEWMGFQPGLFFVATDGSWADADLHAPGGSIGTRLPSTGEVVPLALLPGVYEVSSSSFYSVSPARHFGHRLGRFELTSDTTLTFDVALAPVTGSVRYEGAPLEGVLPLELRGHDREGRWSGAFQPGVGYVPHPDQGALQVPPGRYDVLRDCEDWHGFPVVEVAIHCGDVLARDVVVEPEAGLVLDLELEARLLTIDTALTVAGDVPERSSRLGLRPLDRRGSPGSAWLDADGHGALRISPGDYALTFDGTLDDPTDDDLGAPRNDGAALGRVSIEAGARLTLDLPRGFVETALTVGGASPQGRFALRLEGTSGEGTVELEVAADGGLEVASVLRRATLLPGTYEVFYVTRGGDGLPRNRRARLGTVTVQAGEVASLALDVPQVFVEGTVQLRGGWPLSGGIYQLERVDEPRDAVAFELRDDGTLSIPDSVVRRVPVVPGRYQLRMVRPSREGWAPQNHNSLIGELEILADEVLRIELPVTVPRGSVTVAGVPGATAHAYFFEHGTDLMQPGSNHFDFPLTRALEAILPGTYDLVLLDGADGAPRNVRARLGCFVIE